jgi:predicted Fe-Mo cluster-binding NifX family protein
VPNPSYSSANGAGFQAAQYIASERAAVVISGQFGDDAVNVLKESGVALYQVDTCHTGREAIEQWKAGALLVI